MPRLRFTIGYFLSRLLRFKTKSEYRHVVVVRDRLGADHLMWNRFSIKSLTPARVKRARQKINAAVKKGRT
jgi:hypothetical protein